MGEKIGRNAAKCFVYLFLISSSSVCVSRLIIELLVKSRSTWKLMDLSILKGIHRESQQRSRGPSEQQLCSHLGYFSALPCGAFVVRISEATGSTEENFTPLGIDQRGNRSGLYCQGDPSSLKALSKGVCG